MTDEPSADVCAEWETLFGKYEAARFIGGVPLREARTALDAFVRRCIGVRREPDYFQLERFVDGDWEPFDGKWAEQQAVQFIRHAPPGARLRMLPVFVGRAPVTPDDTRRLREALAGLVKRVAAHRVRRGWPMWGPDHACGECVPGGDIIKAGFRCAYREAIDAAMTATDTPTGAEVIPDTPETRA
jgi:hypothetical protein